MRKLTYLFALVGLVAILAGADTIRSQATLLTLWGNNTSGAISPQDGRDLIVSMGVVGSISSSNMGGTSIDIGSISTSFVDLLVFDTSDVANGTTNDVATNDDITIDSGSEGTCQVTFTSSFAGSNSTVYIISIFKEGVDTGIGAQRSLGTGTDVGTIAASGITACASGDTFDVRVKVTSGSGKEYQAEAAFFTVRRIY